ncbi:MAG: hypothetical protein IJK28_10870 [Clostridia bacterium]|nr:hypothetical protein [Clostridia bacterium]
MKKLMILAMALMLCCTAALAETAEAAEAVVYSPRCLAVLAAQRAMLDKYGITEDMNDYFIRVITESEGGAYTVHWYPSPDNGYGLPWLLGTYEAVVDAEGNVDLSWTHDGVGTDGGMQSKAWGAPQLAEVMEEVRTQFQYINSLSIANEVAAAAGYDIYVGYILPDYDDGYGDDGEVFETGFTLEDMDRIARKAIAEQYPKADLNRLSYWDEEFPCSEYFLCGRPVGVINYALWGDDSADDSWEWSEGDGYYCVVINLQDGSVEELRHESGLSGNG